MAVWVKAAVLAAGLSLPSHAVRVPDPATASLLVPICPHPEAILRCIWQLPARAWCTCGGMSVEGQIFEDQPLSQLPPALRLRGGQAVC